MRLHFLVYIQLLLQYYHPIWSQTTDEPELKSEPFSKDESPKVEKILVRPETSIGMTQLLKQNIFTKENATRDMIVPKKHLMSSIIPGTPGLRHKILPKIGRALRVSKDEHFSIFREDHKDACLDLHKYLMKCKNPDDLLSKIKDVKPLVNDKLLTIATMTVIESKNYRFEIPSLYELFPLDFVPAPYMKQVRDKVTHVTDQVSDLENTMEEQTKHTRNKMPHAWGWYRDYSVIRGFELIFPGSNLNQVGHFIDGNFSPNQKKSEWTTNKYQPFSSYTNWNPLYSKHDSNHQHRSPRKLFNKKLPNNTQEEQKFTQEEATPRLLIQRFNQVVWAADLSGTDRDVQRRLAYFREDFGMNSHHWNWHAVNLLGIDRHDEYFAYMHGQMLARYNFERLSLGVPLVTEYSDFYRHIEEGHQPNLGIQSDYYGTRLPYQAPSNYADLSRQLMFWWRVDNDIRQGVVNERVWFGNFESYHNEGHNNIALTIRRSRNGARGVMLAPETSARDPVFYRWHAHIDRVWEDYKSMKQQVNRAQLTDKEMATDKFEIMSVNLQTDGHGSNQANVLVTGCNYRSFSIGTGLNFISPNTGAQLLMVHLDHFPFTIHIEVKNKAVSVLKGVVRIFLAPKYNANGQEMNIEEQRRMWIELDKFIYSFHPGNNNINRKSQDSAVTVDCTRYDPAENIFFSSNHVLINGHCGCGWPQHLLIPRGNENGMPVLLFVMVTEENHNGRWVQGRSTYCGEVNLKVSETLPMGFPFHVRAPTFYRSIRDLDNYMGNVAVKDVTIKFSGFLTDQNKRDNTYCRKNNTSNQRPNPPPNPNPGPILPPWDWNPWGWNGNPMSGWFQNQG